MRSPIVNWRPWLLTLLLAVAASYGGGSQAVAQQALSGDGTTFVAAAPSLDSAEVRLLDAKTGQVRRTQKARMAWLAAAALSPDGKRLAIGGGNLYHGDVEVVDARSGKSLWVERDVGRHHQVCVTFSPDGKTVAAGTPHGPAKLFDTETGKLKHTLDAKCVTAVAFSPDGRNVAVACRTGLHLDKPTLEVKIWAAESGKMLRALPGVSGPVAFSPDSKTLAAVGADDFVSLWDAAAGKLLRTFKTDGPRPRAGGVAFSPDGKLLATLPAAGPLHLWDSHTAKLLKIRGDDHVGNIGFTPDGNTIVSWSGASGLRRWEVSKLLKPDH